MLSASVFSSPLPSTQREKLLASDHPAAVSCCQAHKFGGSSLADAGRYRAVRALLDDGSDSRIVVVSAMQGVTDALIALTAAVRDGQDWLAEWHELRQRHLATAAEIDAEFGSKVQTLLAGEFAALRHRLAESAARRCEDDGEAAYVHGLGEIWSSYLLHAVLGGQAAGWARLDARDVLVVHPGELGIAVDWNASHARLAEWRTQQPHLNVVVTGFVARDEQGRATTLGRNGSDYSAAIFAALFNAVHLTIWTDVDGVLSADPRLVPDAVCLPSLSYAEACELAYFGAKVLHPQTMAPAMQRGVPIRIRNTSNPQGAGTLISERSEPTKSPVKGLSLVDRLALLELSGAGLIGVPGTAERMFAALRRVGVSVILISQGSSEHSICCVVRQAQAEGARVAVEQAFLEAIGDGQAQGVNVTDDVTVLAAVGDGMVGTPGVSAQLFAGLAKAGVNVRAIAQGASERNISVVVSASDATRALRAAHSAFWLSPQTLSVGVIGPGKVGRALLAQFHAALPRPAGEPLAFDLRLRAIANSRRMLFAEQRLDPAAVIGQLDRDDLDDLDLDAFAAHVRAEHLPHALIVDCSGSDAVAAHYPKWLAAGIHVVTPNKQAGSGPLSRYRAIREASRRGGHFRYEATVGAGLPVIQTLRSMLDTGDELAEVEGVLSGTLAWLFNRFDGSQPFSQLVREAHALGYTEPDPRDDLSGIDVARKLVILAREAGRTLTLADVEIESLVPSALQGIGTEAFFARLHELDADMRVRFEKAKQEGLALRYLARLDRDGQARVGLVAASPDHASAHSRLTDNLIQFRTRRYAENPLVVQGPGAGPEVTAAGVFGDILAIVQMLGARV